MQAMAATNAALPVAFVPRSATDCTPSTNLGYHRAVKRPWPSTRMLTAYAAALCLAVAFSADAAGKPARKPGRSRSQASTVRKEPPPPDPLAGAWPSREKPQLGDGSLRSEILVAARRLVGLSGSFDEDGFVRHLAYVLDLARKKDLDEDAWSRALARRAAARGVLKKDAKAQPGDVVLMSLDPSRPGSAKAARVLAGVVESRVKGGVRFIAPIGGTVSRGIARPGKKPNPSDTALRECRAPDAPKVPAAKAGKKKGKAKAKASKAARPLPCRAGQLWIGRIPADALPRLF